MKNNLQLWSAVLATWLASIPTARSSPACEEITIAVEASAEHAIWQGAPGPDDEVGHIRFIGDAFGLGPAPVVTATKLVSGTFDIAGTFCRPSSSSGTTFEPGNEQARLAKSITGNDTKVLQILVSGNTFNKESWSCYGFAEDCSWTSYAAGKGYYTLAIDRLGTGKSSHPDDTITTMQAPIQVEIVHEIIQRIRSGQLVLKDASGAAIAFDKIVMVGYSYGALLGVALSRNYPSDVDALVLAGFSGRLHLPPQVLLLHLIPAKRVETKPHFASLPAGYLTAATEGTNNNGLYKGSWDPELARIDWEHRDVVSAGEYASVGVLLAEPSGFTGPVMAIAGDMDGNFCHEAEGTCAESLAATVQFFPKVEAKLFSYFVAEKTGHGVLMHSSAPEVHAAAHQWLDEVL